jgi:hypothetical protein
MVPKTPSVFHQAGQKTLAAISYLNLVTHTTTMIGNFLSFPLFDALAVGYKSVGADIWLPEDAGSTDLRVGHKKSALTPDRTLASLYIKPILAML